jgi:sulfide:quinone oxidoreductase
MMAKAMDGKTVVILGGGVGGLVAANELRRRLSNNHRVCLVEKSARHAFAPSFLWLMVGDREPAGISRNIQQLVRPGVELVQAEALAIDLDRRKVETSVGSLDYDYLIVALGAELVPKQVPGLAEGAETFYTFEGSVGLRDRLRDFSGGKVAIVIAGLPYKCPGAPPEAAMLIAHFFERRRLREKVEIHLFTPESQPMPVAGPELGASVRQMLEGKGIVLHPLHKLARVDPEARLLYFQGQEAVTYDLLVAVPPHRGPLLAGEAGLANEAGWVPVDRATLTTKHENVYAVGDATTVPLPGRWKSDVPLMLPKAGVFAHAQAEVAARRIAGRIAGMEPRDVFCGDGYCMLEAGEDMAGFAYGNFFAEPSPQVQLRKLGWTWHLGKVLFEQWWLAPFGLKRSSLGLGLKWGARALRIPVVI